jgi:hypothetical protein
VNDLSIRPDESVAALEQRRAAAPTTNGQAVAPLPPAGPPNQWIVLGPRTLQQLARLVLEQAPLSATVLVALLETSGVPPGVEYQLVLEGAHLEPVTPKG